MIEYKKLIDGSTFSLLVRIFYLTDFSLYVICIYSLYRVPGYIKISAFKRLWTAIIGNIFPYSALWNF